MDDYVSGRYRRCANGEFYALTLGLFLAGFVCGFLAHWILQVP